MNNKEKAREIANNCSTAIVGAEVSDETYITTEPDCYTAAMQAMKLKDKQFQKVLDYVETCYGVFCFGQRDDFINHIKDIFYENENND